MANWSLLPSNLILRIANGLSSVDDFLAFSLVCRSWKSVYNNKSWNPTWQVPWLMLSEDQNRQTRTFYSLCNEKSYNLPLPEAKGKMCWGTSLGWLVTLGSDCQLRLLNPITHVSIDLPPLIGCQGCDRYRLPWYKRMYKVVAFEHGMLGEGCSEIVVMAIHRSWQLSLVKPGDSAWTTVQAPSSLSSFSDVICFRGKIYGICGIGKLVSVDIDDQAGPPRVTFVAPPPNRWAWEYAHLVESGGDLLMVQKYEYGNAQHVGFGIYKLDSAKGKWVELQELKGRSIFVGGNFSMSVSISAVDKLKSNCIYFMADFVEYWWNYEQNWGFRDMGAYNVSDGSVEPFYYGADYPCFYSCPVWTMPRFV